MLRPLRFPAIMLKDDFVFIDTEFSPSRLWLSLGAVMHEDLFYAHTFDRSILSIADAEFSDAPVGREVLGQLAGGSFWPGPVESPAEMARAFSAWLKRKDSCTLQICYDYSGDMQLLEDAMHAADLPWPTNWSPCNLAILNHEPAADAARERVWSAFERRYRLRKHHALADAAALQAAYSAQSSGL